ncbi:cell wall-binding repeat-containing protein [Herbiconiux sp. P15]|uniref:cell wall-binding repeat-containing protein n=1 Tax=Herbiconiux liukaitaii TaxID=3342799 RepID=UPI0035BA6BE1
MTPSSSRRRRRNALLTTATIAGLALAPALAATTSAAAATLMICPPVIEKVGQNIVQDTVDSESNPPYDTTISAGALPDGLSITPRGTFADQITGSPTKVGTFSFTVKIYDPFKKVSQTNDCTVVVMPADFTVERIGGVDRYEESVLISKKVAPTTASVVYVASGETFTDALSGSAVAGQRGAPLLLSASAAVPSIVGEEITRLAPSQIVVLGGEKTLAPEVIAQLKALRPTATITRIGGVDRYEVSRNLIAHPTFGAPASTKLYTASGTVFSDALSASPAAAKADAPVLLLNGTASALSSAEASLIAARGVTDVTLFGGADTLSAGLESDLKSKAGTTRRIEGNDRYDVSSNTGLAFFPAANPVETVYLASGAVYPDALAGTSLAAKTDSPIFLAEQYCLRDDVAKQIGALKVKKVVLLGGPDTLSTYLESFTACVRPIA